MLEGEEGKQAISRQRKGRKRAGDRGREASEQEIEEGKQAKRRERKVSKPSGGRDRHAHERKEPRSAAVSSGCILW